MRTRRRDSGITLMELLLCIGIMATVLGAAGIAFSQTLRLRGMHSAYGRRLAAAEFLLRRVSRDARAAVSAPAEEGAYSAGSGTLILRSVSTVVYRTTESGVERLEISDGTGTRTAPILDADGLRVSFDREERAGEVRSVVVSVEWDEPAAVGISQPALSLRIPLKGEARP